MRIDLTNLPSDPDILHQIIATLDVENHSLLSEKESLRSENSSLLSQNDSLHSEIDLLRKQLKLLKAKRFSKSSEKLDNQIAQLELWIEESEIKNADSTLGPEVLGDDNPDDVKGKPKRQPLPEHLPREEVTLAPEPECPKCGGEEFRKIADDISEILEYVPSSFKVIRHIRPRCVCIKCENIVQAYAPSKAIDKGKAGPGLLAHILVQKYCNHLPIYRQHEIYKREGVEIAKSTMTSWAGRCVRLLHPLIEELKRSVFSGSHIHGDDTSVKVLAPGLGKTKIGRIWSYVRDSRPYGGTSPPVVCYFYSPDRKGERPKQHLQGFEGVLHADAYAGYDRLYASKENPAANITEAACWAHTRRKFYEVTVATDNANIALSVLEQVSTLYKIEAEIKGLDPGKRLERRQDASKELVEKLFINLKKWRKDLSSKSMTAKAINYALNNEIALQRFLGDGKIEIDNNAAERSMRSIAVGRKNWLFAGSDKGGDTAAGIYSLIETAKMNDINPHLYLEKVLTIIQDYNHKKIADLLPWNITL